MGMNPGADVEIVYADEYMQVELKTRMAAGAAQTPPTGENLEI